LINKWHVIFVGVTVVVLVAFGYMRSGGVDYALHEVSLDSKEVRQIENMIKRLQQSINHFSKCLNKEVGPMAKQQLGQQVLQINQALEVTVKRAEWAGDYFRVHVGSLSQKNNETEHWFLLAAR
jgi:t-SNARE complex subunit (syntaxin)